MRRGISFTAAGAFPRAADAASEAISPVMNRLSALKDRFGLSVEMPLITNKGKIPSLEEMDG